MAVLKNLMGTIALTRDWPHFVLNRFARARAGSKTFRLRNGQVISIGTDQAFVLNEIYRDRIYDVPDVDLGSCRTIVDLGANVGVFALYAAAKAPNANIYCFEPATATFAVLQDNLIANHVNVAAHRVAISTSCGSALFYHAGTAAEWSLKNDASRVSEEVRCIDLDRLFEIVCDDAIDFLKMDVEGAELTVLGGAGDEQLRQIGALSVEWHHPMEALVSFADRLRHLGFIAETDVADGNVRYLKARQRKFPLARKDALSR
jgi:FkbM family methyltransferase